VYKLGIASAVGSKVFKLGATRATWEQIVQIRSNYTYVQVMQSWSLQLMRWPVPGSLGKKRGRKIPSLFNKDGTVFSLFCLTNHAQFQQYWIEDSNQFLVAPV
jgi:hypothetical protein